MKSIKTLLLLITISSCLLSCSKDDELNEENYSTKIIGTWLLTSQTINGENVELEECDHTVTFADNTMIVKFYFGDNCESLESYGGIYALKGSTLILTYDNEDPVTVKITSLNNTTLKTQWTDVANGETNTYTETFTKQ